MQQRGHFTGSLEQIQTLNPALFICFCEILLNTKPAHVTDAPLTLLWSPARLSPTAGLSLFTKWANIFSTVPFQLRFDTARTLFWLRSATRPKQESGENKYVYLEM